MKRPRNFETASSDESGDSESEQGDSQYHNSDEERSDVDSPLSSDIKLRLRNSLGSLPATMSFASTGLCPIEANPAISVAGLGGIGLPLSERDAQLVSNVSHQAPYGKGSDTVVDPAVRKTKELNADQFEIKNPEWQKALDAVVCRATKELGVPGGAVGVEAVLHKLLLYEKGAMFKEHRDSEKAPGMFGTLVICLPSKHEGGEVHVSHGGHRKVLQTAESSDFKYTYLCWYGDVKHQITKVTSGYRFVLTYNLINTNPRKPIKIPTKLASKRRDLENVLSFWKDSYKKNASSCPTVLAYILEHLYTKKSLSYHGLKGFDRLRGQCLLEFCNKHGILIYLAKLERGVEGECGDEDNEEDWQEIYWRARRNEEPDVHCITDVTQEWLQLQDVVELDGTRLLDIVPLSESQIVQDNPFDNDPDEEDFSGPTGNEGVTATHFYHRSAVILMPEEYRIDFIFQSYVESEANLYRWVDGLITNADGPGSEEDLRKACRLIAQGGKKWQAEKHFGEANPFTDHLLGIVMRGGLHLGDESLCCEALSAAIEQLPQPTTVEAIKRFGFAKLKNEIKNSIQRFSRIHQSLEALIGIYDTYRAEKHDSKTLKDILESMKTETRNICSRQRMFSTRDGTSVAEVGIRCGKTYLIKQLVPAIKLQISGAKRHWIRTNDAVLGFLTRIAKGLESNEITRKTAQDIFHAVLKDFIPIMGLVDSHGRSAKRSRISETCIPLTLLHSTDIIQLLRQITSLDLGAEAHQLLDKLEKLANDEEDPAIIFRGFFLPFAKGLSKTSADESPGALVQEVQSRAQPFIEKVVDLYASRCVGPKPTPPKDWQRTKGDCGCKECSEVDSFLVDPAQKEIKISLKSQDRVDHLKGHLPQIPRGTWDKKPEHDTEVRHTDLGLELLIRKTQLRWSTEVQCWEEDRKAAEKEFGRVFKDENIKKILERRLDSFSKEVGSLS